MEFYCFFQKKKSKQKMKLPTTRRIQLKGDRRMQWKVPVLNKILKNEKCLKRFFEQKKLKKHP